MSVLFLGDIACPAGLTPRIEGLDRLPGDLAVVNLEGSLRASGGRVRGKKVALYNSPDVLPSLRQWRVRVASLANNHVMDFGDGLGETAALLQSAEIASCGAGRSLAEASAPAIVEHAGESFCFLAFGWHVIEAPPAGLARAGVNPLEPAHVLSSIAAARAQYPAARVVALMHWDYELERFPMPAHRQLAFDMVAAGANAVVGHHPHCVQGIEWVEGAPIAYSLGNWFLPHGDWFGAPLAYPAYAARQLALEWHPSERRATCHWFDYLEDGHAIRLVGSDDAQSGERTRQLTPFAGMSQRDYASWFRRHRVKRRGLPIYRDYHSNWTNRSYDWWNRLRMKGVRLLRRL